MEEQNLKQKCHSETADLRKIRGLPLPVKFSCSQQRPVWNVSAWDRRKWNLLLLKSAVVKEVLWDSFTAGSFQTCKGGLWYSASSRFMQSKFCVRIYQRVRNLSTSSLWSIYCCCSKWIDKVNTAYAGLVTAHKLNKNCNGLWCIIIFQENVFCSTLKEKKHCI